MFGGYCVWGHNALCLYFDVLVSSGRFWLGRGGASPQQMTADRWGWEHRGAQCLDAVLIGESYRCGHSAKKRKCSPMRRNGKQEKLAPERKWVLVEEVKDWKSMIQWTTQIYSERPLFNLCQPQTQTENPSFPFSWWTTIIWSNTAYTRHMPRASKNGRMNL